MESVTETNKASRDYIPILAVIGGIIAVVSLFIYWVNIDTTFSYSFFEIPYTMKATAIKVVEGSTDIPDDWHIYCPALAGIFAIIGVIVAAICIARKKKNLPLYVAVFVCGLLSLQFAILFAAWNFDVMYTVTESDQANIQNLAVVLQAVLGDPTATEAVHYSVAQQAVAAGQFPDIATAMAAIPSDTAVDMAVAQVQATLGLDLTDPAVQAALAAADPSDFVAGNELVVGYMKVQEVVETGFWACILGGVLVTITGIIGTLKAAKH